MPVGGARKTPHRIPAGTPEAASPLGEGEDRRPGKGGLLALRLGWWGWQPASLPERVRRSVFGAGWGRQFAGVPGGVAECRLAGLAVRRGQGKVGRRRVGVPSRRSRAGRGRATCRHCQTGSARRSQGGWTDVCSIPSAGTVETARWGWMRTAGRTRRAGGGATEAGRGSGRGGRWALDGGCEGYSDSVH